MEANCDLLVPYKKWSGDPHEEQNYYAMERWARRNKGSKVSSSPVALASSVPEPSPLLSLTQVSRGVWSKNVSVPSGSYVPVDTTGFAVTDVIGSDIVPTTNGFQVVTQGLTVWSGTVWMPFTAPVQAGTDCAYNVQFYNLETRRRDGTDNNGPAAGLYYGFKMTFSGGYFLLEGETIPWQVKQMSGATQTCKMLVTLTHIQM